MIRRTFILRDKQGKPLATALDAERAAYLRDNATVAGIGGARIFFRDGEKERDVTDDLRAGTFSADPLPQPSSAEKWSLANPEQALNRMKRSAVT